MHFLNSKNKKEGTVTFQVANAHNLTFRMSKPFEDDVRSKATKAI
jgi:hypothetical protein